MNTELPRRRRRRRDILVQSLVVSSAALVLVVASAGSAAARVIGSAGAISPGPGTTFPPTAIATAVSQLFDPWASPDLVSPPITPHPATMTWTANEANPCVNPQVRSTGYQPGDFTTDLGTGTLPATSPSIYDPPGLTRECSPGSSLICARWGDYSAVSPDPSAYSGCDPGRRMWLVNERDVSRTDWGSQIAELGWC